MRNQSDPPAVIGRVTGSSAEFYFQIAAAESGLQIGKDVVLRNLPLAEQAQLPKGVAAVVPWDLTASLITQERTAGRSIDISYPYNIYQGNHYIRQELVEQVPDVAQALTSVPGVLHLPDAEWAAGFPGEGRSRPRLGLQRQGLEPFAALDAQSRSLMQGELARIREFEAKTVVLVTHSIDKAIKLADRIVVMTRRPARVKEIIAVDLPRPRHEDGPDFITLRRRIGALIRDDPKTQETAEPALPVALAA